MMRALSKLPHLNKKTAAKAIAFIAVSGTTVIPKLKTVASHFSLPLQQENG
jgi:hypothetical protein